MAQPVEVKDFSGGRTDNYVDGPVNRFKLADNLLVVKHGNDGKLLSRFGSEIYDDAAPLVNASIERLGAIRNFKTDQDEDVLVFSNRKIYTNVASVWTELLGPSSNKLFPTGTTTANVVSYAEWNNQIFVTNDAFAAPSKIYNDASGNLKLRTAGLPNLATAPTVTPTGATGKTYIYAFFYKYTYAVRTVSFEDDGAITQVLVTNSDFPNVNQNNITAIPVLSNSTVFNWDTANIKVQIYRTINGGADFYFVGEVTNGTTVFTDNFSDATILTHVQIYTAGGIVENDPTPLAKLVHITGDIGYWANIKDGTELLTNRLLQAVPGDPDSVPADFFVDVQDEIVGLSSTRSLPVLMCASSVYRVDGFFDEFGRGGMSATKISDTATCVSSQSVVQTIEGVFWAGEDSYYFSDGYQVLKLCRDWATTYLIRVASTTQKKRIQGKYDKRTRRIWWTFQSESGGSDDCDGCDVLHLDWGIKEDAVFSSVSGGDSFAPTAIEFINGDMLRGDRRGYLLNHSNGLRTDPLIDVLVTPADWDTRAIIWDYQSCSSNLGTTDIKKYTTKIVTTCANQTNLSLQIISINDDGKKIENLKPIRFRGNVEWGDEFVIWGDPSIIWGFSGLINEQSRFPANSLRCIYKQIKMTNANVVVINSDSLGTVTVNNVLKTATLDNASSIDWPSHLLGYTISFGSDGYVAEYDVVSRTADTITYLDARNISSSGSGVTFVIRGEPKGEIFNLLSYAINFQYIGQTQAFYTASESGAVGT